MPTLECARPDPEPNHPKPKPERRLTKLRSSLGTTFEVKLQLVHTHQFTNYHRDNGGADTWMKILAGKVFVACWSQADGDKYQLTDDDDETRGYDAEKATWLVDWEKVRRMPSARLFLMEPGDVLVMPAGTYHYVRRDVRRASRRARPILRSPSAHPAFRAGSYPAQPQP